MDLDESIFSDLAAINAKWTAHADEGSEDNSSDIEAQNGSALAEMTKEIALHKAQIVSQQEELRELRELVEKIHELQAAASSTNTLTTAFYSGSFSDCEVDRNARQTEVMVNEITMSSGGKVEHTKQQAAVAIKSDSERDSDTEEDFQERVR